MSELSPADQARNELIGAALQCVAALGTDDETADAADDALDLAAIRLVTELEAERQV